MLYVVHDSLVLLDSERGKGLNVHIESTVACLIEDGWFLIRQPFTIRAIGCTSSRPVPYSNCVPLSITPLSNAFSAVPDIKFDNIVSNLPANVGKEMLWIILHDAKAHLKDEGKLYIVTIAGLRRFIRRNFEEVFGNYQKIKQGKTYTVGLGVNT